MTSEDIPYDIAKQLQGKSVEIVFSTKRDYLARKIGIVLVVFSIVWGFIPALFAFFFSIPLILLIFTQTTTPITYNGDVVNSPLSTILFSLIPVIVCLVISLPTIVAGYTGIALFRRKGCWYAITRESLIEFKNGAVTDFPWNSFETLIKSKKTKKGMDIVLTSVKSRDIPEYSPAPTQGTVFVGHMFKSKAFGLLGVSNGELVLNYIRENINNVVRKVEPVQP